ncbi:WD domain-containing protein [Xylariales sp. AK1849]|nr:WD domain-containing protein [Xylariales sp. AK1849]
MATVLPPPSKRRRREALERTQVQADVTPAPLEAGSFKARFIDGDSNQLAEVVEIPLADSSEKNVSLLLNTLLGRAREDFTPYRFRIHVPSSDAVIETYPSPQEMLLVLRNFGITNPFETTLTLSAEPQAVFKVQAVTRMSNRIPGHGEAILSRLATGGGDCTARIWDTDTGTPKYTLSGHTGWVLSVAWSADGSRLASSSYDKTVRIWDPETGKAVGRPFSGHAKWVNALAWEPFHQWRDETPRLASASKDGTVRIWIVNTGQTEHVLSGHSGNVSCVRWGGKGLIYTSSHDKTVKVWNAVDGTLKHTLAAHAHWVNHLALSTEFVLRTGYFDHTKEVPKTIQERRAKAEERFKKAATKQGKVTERLLSASDDFTMYLWDPEEGTKPVARLLGHQKQVNHVQFSPDGALIASAGFDNHTKIWSARDGKFINTLRGHVAPVYQCCFSADSRLLVTASKDTTLKVWDMRTCKLSVDLPGHQDEVYAVDWSPRDGQRVSSGGKVSDFRGSRIFAKLTIRVTTNPIY